MANAKLVRSWQFVIVAAVSWLAIYTPIASAATLGKTTLGTTWGGGFFANLDRANAYRLTEAGRISKLHVYLGPMSVRGSEFLRGVIYSDSNGSPGALLTTTRTLRFSNRSATRWYDLALPRPLRARPGTYWLGILAGGKTGVAGYRWDWVSNSRVLAPNQYVRGPSKRFGSYYTDNREMSLYATYTQVGKRSAPISPPVPVSAAPASPAIPVGSASPASWFGAYASAGGCFNPRMWSNSNPTPANGYTSSDGGFQGCVPDPNGSGQMVLEQKVTPNTCGWSCEQRMDWQSTRFITSGADVYISVPILVPTYQSLIGGNAWLVMFNENYGLPANTSPADAMNVYQENGQLVFGFGGNTTGHTGGEQHLWMGSTPANDGKWHDFIEHFVASTNKSIGTIELWEDGSPITFNACSNSSTLSGCGTTTLHYPTLITGGTDQSNNWVQLNNYRNNSPSSYTSTLFHGGASVGSSYASVYNTLINPPYGP
jgi:hypothetical protein